MLLLLKGAHLNYKGERFGSELSIGQSIYLSLFMNLISSGHWHVVGNSRYFDKYLQLLCCSLCGHNHWYISTMRMYTFSSGLAVAGHTNCKVL